MLPRARSASEARAPSQPAAEPTVMTSSPLPRILVVDDEEAILETMTFTFMDTYEVITSSDARKALALLDDHAPVAVAISDQRMPNMTGTEFLAERYERNPETVRIMLTGFADVEATWPICSWLACGRWPR